MSAPDLLNELRRMGLRLSAQGSELHVSPRAAITEEARRLIRDHKPEILKALAGPEEMFSFTPPGDPANDAEAVSERAAIMAVENGWDEDRALQEARWTVDRERCWRAFLRNAERILDAPGAKHGAMISIYQAEAIRRYGESTGRDMALSLASWVRARRVH